MLGILSEPELRELTGRCQRPKQIETLRSMRVQFLVRPDGSVAVARAHVEAMLGLSSAPPKNREPELRL